MRRKELLAAGLIRDILFCSNDEVDLYIHELEYRCVQYEILDRYVREDGSEIIRIMQQYNNVPLIEL